MENLLHYSPILLAVMIFLIQQRIVVTPEQLERVTVISEPFFTYSKWKANGDTLSDSDRKAIVGVVEKAHEMGKPIRFWASPDNPQAWETLHNLGVDVINTDNPEACTLYFRALEKK